MRLEHILATPNYWTARYGVLRGGKRLRPALVYAAADAAGASLDAADAAAITS